MTLGNYAEGLRPILVQRYLCNDSHPENPKVICKKSKGHIDTHVGCDMSKPKRVIVRWEEALIEN